VNIDDLQKVVGDVIGFEPHRFKDGFGAIGDALGAPKDKAGQIIADAAIGKKGSLDRFTDWVNDIKPFGKFDMGALSSRAERSASQRAFVTGYLQGWNRYFWKPGKGFDDAYSFLPAYVQDQLNAVDRGIIPAINNAIASGKNPEDINKIFRGNLNLSLNNIMDDASRRLGYNVAESLPDEFVAKIEKGLYEASEQSGDAVRTYFTKVRQELQDEFDELAGHTVARYKGDTIAQIRAEGPGAFSKIWAQQMNAWHDADIYHAESMERIAQSIRAQTDPDVTHAMWRALNERNDQFYTREWDRFDGVVQGLVEGAREEGIRISDEAVTTFKQWKRGWRDWWGNKRKIEGEFWDARRAGETPPRGWDDIRAEVSKGYDEMSGKEDELTRKLNELVERSLPPEFRDTFRSWRTGAADLARNDKEAIKAFWREVEGLPAEERAARFTEFWQGRIQREQEMVQWEHLGNSAMQGDPEAIARLQQADAARPPFMERNITNVDVDTTRRTDLPEFVAKQVEDEAGRLQAELSGTGVELIPAKEGEGLVRSSTNPDWYIELYNQGFRRKSVEGALKRIIEGNDIPRANEKTIQAVKSLIYDRLLEGTGEYPPSPGMLLFWNQPDEAAQALGRYLADPTWAKGATTESWVQLVGDEDNTRRLLARLMQTDEELAGEADAIINAIRGVLDEPTEAVTKPYIQDMYKMAPKQLDIPVAKEQYWRTYGMPSLDAMEQSTLEQLGKPALKWDGLSDDAKEVMESYLQHVQGQMSDARYASTRFAEYKRDAALLNYNRRTNFDTYATMLFPYQFWFTHSAMQWMMHSVDRPAMLSTFLKVKEFMNTAGAPNQALPSRLRGSIRVGVPFLPPEMGDSIFFDPIRALLPFDTFAYPFERLMQRNSTLEGRTEFILNDMLENNQISEQEFNEAIADPNHELWQRARGMAIEDDDELKYSAWDFASTLSAPHAPLVWAMESLQGTPENIPPFTPASRTIKGAAGLLGVDWNRSPMNIEGRVRESLGLPAFDKWDDYRIDRMLSNMTAMGDITADEALRAMIEREGPAYDEASKKAAFEFGIGAMGSTLGIPAKAYPEGEFLQRSLKDDYQKAWELYEAGDDQAYNRFNQLHPEYETRLALWKSPEERLRNFMVDDLWGIWNDLPSLTKRELMEQIPEMEEKFVNKDTRNYEAIEIGEMQGWLKLLGGDPPGTLESEPAPIDLADPEVAWRTQVFYDTRRQYFPDWYEIQSEYYDIPEDDKDARKEYREANPILVDYWDWRRDWLHRNPETVPYLTDKDYEFKYSTPQMERRAQEPQPWLTWDEWQQIMGPNASRLMRDFIDQGEPIPAVMEEQLDELAVNLGISMDELYDLVEQSIK